jgi:hypothetical protein
LWLAPAGYPHIKLLEGRWHSGRFFRLFLGRTGSVSAGAHQLSLPLRDGWNMVTERLLIAIGEQDERYGSERYGDQRSEGGAQIGFPIVGCLVVRHRDLRLSALCRQRLHRIEVPARVATRRNPALRRTQAPSGSRCCRFRLGAALADDGCRPAGWAASQTVTTLSGPQPPADQRLPDANVLEEIYRHELAPRLPRVVE